MTSDLAKLMEKIDLLQSEALPEPVIEIEKPTMHPLLQAMQELKEDGVVESVDAHTIYSNVQSGHREPDDFVEGDIGDRIYWFDDYKLSSLPISNLNLDEHYVDEDLVDDYIEHIKYSPKTMPPIVYDPIAKSIIDGIHRANAYAKLGYETIPAYVGLTKSDSYGERESDNIDEEIAYHGTVDDIAEFYPLTHFGTEKAAKDRMEYKKIKDGKIYKVDLNIKNPLTIKDFPGIHYDRLYAFELKNKKLISQEEMEAITFIQDKAELRKALLAKLKELGIDGFVYKNRYEDKGHISYVIVDPRQVKVLSVEPAAEEVTEASPDTLEGSFTPDLVESKTWLAEMLAKGLKGKNAGTIYVLGSWYGNMGIFLQQAGVQFDKLVLIEPDEEALMRSKDLLQQIGDEGKLILIHQKAEDAVYEKPGVVINTSCNETGPVFLTKLPDNMLCLLQARNNNENTLFPTEDEEDFIDYFPLETVYYTGKKQLEDPEVNYVRYMKIGRTGKALDEAITTGQGGGSAGVGGGQMVGGPTTYEQEYGMFKSKGPRRIMAMTEALDSSYPYRNSKQNPGNDFYFDTEDGQEYKVQFSSIWGDDVTVGFAARGQGDEHKIGLTGTGNSRKIFGTVIKIVKDYIRKSNPEIISFSANNSEPSRVRLYKMLASQSNKELPNYNFADEINDGEFTTFYLTQNDAKIPTSTKVKAKASKALDAVFEEES
jgi:hypothetical protein